MSIYMLTWPLAFVGLLKVCAANRWHRSSQCRSEVWWFFP